MAALYLTQTHPIIGEAWRRTHLPVSRDGKLAIPFLGYVYASEHPDSAEHPLNNKDNGAIFVFDENLAETYAKNPDWFVSLNHQSKFGELVGSIAWDVFYYSLWKSHRDHKESASPGEKPVDEPTLPGWPNPYE